MKEENLEDSYFGTPIDMKDKIALPNNLKLITSSDIHTNPNLSKRPLSGSYENHTTSQRAPIPFIDLSKLNIKNLTRKELTDIYEKLKLMQYESNKGCPSSTKFEFLPLQSCNKSNIYVNSAYRIFYISGLSFACSNALEAQLKVSTIMYSDVSLLSSNIMDDKSILLNEVANTLLLRHPLLTTELFEPRTNKKLIIYDAKFPTEGSEIFDPQTTSLNSKKEDQLKLTVLNNAPNCPPKEAHKQELLLKERKRIENSVDVLPVSLTSLQTNNNSNESCLISNLTRDTSPHLPNKSEQNLFAGPEQTQNVSDLSSSLSSNAQNGRDIRMSMSPSLSPPPTVVKNSLKNPVESQNDTLSGSSTQSIPPVLMPITDFQYAFLENLGETDHIKSSSHFTGECRFLFNLHDRIFTIDPQSFKNAPDMPAMPISLGSNFSQQHPYDLKICPNDANLISYISCGNIYIYDISSENHLQLTQSTDKYVSCGIPSFVTQEEFDRFTGYYWKPNSQLIDYHYPAQTPEETFKNDTDNFNRNQNGSNNITNHKVYKYSILYEVNDERQVETLKIPTNLEDDLLTIEDQKFPRPGTKNSKTYLYLCEFIYDSTNHKFLPFPSTLPTTCYSNLETSTKHNNANLGKREEFAQNLSSRPEQIFALNSTTPGAELLSVNSIEYLVRFGWILDTTSIWFQALNRTQDTLVTYVTSTDAFTKIDQNYSQIRQTNAEIQSKDLPDMSNQIKPKRYAEYDKEIMNPTSNNILNNDESHNNNLVIHNVNTTDMNNRDTLAIKRKILSNSTVPIHVEQSLYWINVSNILYFLREEDELGTDKPTSNTSNEITLLSFIVLSEETFYKHLYKYTVDLRIPCAFNDKLDSTTALPLPNTMKKMQLTHGPWVVNGDKIWVDETRKLVYFIGNMDGPLERHLYVVSYNYHTDPIRLTQLGYSHSIHMSQDCEIFVDTYSSVDIPTCIDVYAIVTGQNLTIKNDSANLAHTLNGHPSNYGTNNTINISTKLIGILHRPRPETVSHLALPPPEFFNFCVEEKKGDTESSTTTLYGMLFKPFDHDCNPTSSKVTNNASLPSTKTLPSVTIFNHDTPGHHNVIDNTSTTTTTLVTPKQLPNNNGNTSKVLRLHQHEVESMDSSSYAIKDTNILTSIYDIHNGPLPHNDTNIYKNDPSFAPTPLPTQIKTHPTLLYVYGGPQIQQVTNSYKGSTYFKIYCLNALGFICVVIDNRGSSNRGLRFESYLKHAMGSIELEDQIAGLKYVNEVLHPGLIDFKRIAIHGWSYGGYLSLRALIARPDVFKVAVSGAPVTTWTEYDTGYTERYMGSPSQTLMNDEIHFVDTSLPDYDVSDIANKAHLFPDEENRLVLVHGLMDENVHFHNTALLIQNLIKFNKPYRLMVYPTERHGLRNYVSSRHFDISFLKFLIDYL